MNSTVSEQPTTEDLMALTGCSRGLAAWAVADGFAASVAEGRKSVEALIAEGRKIAAEVSANGPKVRPFVPRRRTLRYQPEGASVVEDAPTAQDWMAQSAIMNGTYTLVGPRGRRTVEVETIKGNSDFAKKFLGRRVVKLLVGPDNTSDYLMIGWLRPGDVFEATARNRGTANETIGKAFAQIVTKGIDGYSYQMASCCRRCNRVLTVPSSIDAGLGPDCAEKGLL